jgi:Lar family restriction alleviation protein
MSKIELKACPFCGAKPNVRVQPESWGYHEGSVEVQCKCGASAGSVYGADKKREAAEKWNARVPQWQPIEFNEDGAPTNVPADTPILVPPTKRLGMTVAKWNPLDGWETETTSEWVGMYRPTHFQPLPAPPEVEG